MDFLRRLDPGRAAAPGAARLDLAPRWIDVAPAPVDAAASLPAERVAPPAPRPVRVSAERPRSALDAFGRGDPAATPAEAATTLAQAGPARTGLVTTARLAERVPSAAAPSALPPADPTAPRSAPLDRTVPPEAEPARAVVPVEPKPPAAPSLPPSARTVPAEAAPDGPLRVEALAERRPPAGGAPPIVHVTIDRIDVRLPAAGAPTAQSERRPRPSGSVAPLAAYLRGGGRA